MSIDLAGKPILITGGSSGIGRATALACARSRMPVVLFARRENKLKEAVAEIEAIGGRASYVVGDVTSKEDNERAAQACIDTFGGLYAVFANAGYGYELPFDEQTEEQVREIFETNFFGTMNTVNAALPHLKAQKSGHVLICSSSIGVMPIAYYGAYCATKAAQHHLGRALTLELRPFNVSCSTVHPIGTTTEFFDTLKEHSGGADAITFDHTPKWAMQPASKVAGAVLKCLQRPKPEVWTSLPVRLGIVLGLLTPGLTDFFLKGYVAKRQALVEKRSKTQA